MEIDLYKDFCLNISSNSKEIIERIYSLPYEISHKILNEFSTRILKTKIHPILQDEIYMTSFPGYRQFWRSERDYMGKYMNKSRIRTLIHIYVFMDTSIVSPQNICELVWLTYKFIPSISFIRSRIIPLVNSLCLRKNIRERIIYDIYKNKFNFNPQI